jgi:6-phosphogluconolactonase
MANIQINNTSESLASLAAAMTVNALADAITKKGRAIWCLAGGNTPAAAYKKIVLDYKEELPWQKVWIILGDERCVPESDNDSNWGQIKNIFEGIGIPEDQKIMPDFSLKSQAAADYYNDQLTSLIEPGKTDLVIDILWLGIGEDGHTLSLFPGKKDLYKNMLITIVDDSPKPPPQRISLTLKALNAVTSCLIICSGNDKAEAIAGAVNSKDLPITKVVEKIESQDGAVTWLLDEPAASML